MNNLVDQIRQHRKRLGKQQEPEFLFLGSIEYLELLRLAEPFGITADNLHLDGLRVIRANVPRMIAFGEEPSPVPCRT